MLVAFYMILSQLPEDITFSKALEIAGASGKMEVVDFSFDSSKRYTVWTGILGGTFLMLSYFGTDQSQVQRYLSGKSVRESQLGLIFNALLKVPMQFFILLIGVMVFVFYQFNTAPLNFNPSANSAIYSSEYISEYKELEAAHIKIENSKKVIFNDGFQINEISEVKELNAKDLSLRIAVKEIIKKIDSSSKVKIESNDKDYVFIYFILNNLPRGLIGLLLAVILSAAMSSTASELSALSSTTAIDIYKRNIKENKTDEHYVKASKWFTLLWGIIAITVACFANLSDNLIQLVNIIGSIFYGNILGIFLLAFFIKYVKGNAVFIAAIITQIVIIAVYFLNWLPYLWLNLLGCALVMGIAIILQSISKLEETQY